MSEIRFTDEEIRIKSDYFWRAMKAVERLDMAALAEIEREARRAMDDRNYRHWRLVVNEVLDVARNDERTVQDCAARLAARIATEGRR